MKTKQPFSNKFFPSQTLVAFFASRSTI